jgi:hypothetical protein
MNANFVSAMILKRAGKINLRFSLRVVFQFVFNHINIVIIFNIMHFPQIYRRRFNQIIDNTLVFRPALSIAKSEICQDYPL